MFTSLLMFSSFKVEDSSLVAQNGGLLHLEAPSDMVLNCPARNLNNSTSSLTSTTISSLSLRDSKLKVSSQVFLSAIYNTPRSFYN